MKVFVLGHKGWIAQQFIECFQKLNIDYTYSDSRAETEQIYKDIKVSQATNVLCCIGRTHGVIDTKKFTTIDYLQNPQTLKENLTDNLYAPVRLAHFCDKENIHFTYIGTGCIYTYDGDKKIFTEKDEPNFFGSNYSLVKGFTNNLMKNTKALHLRIRMPITSRPNERNFITKITNYEHICSIHNSMSVLDELIPIAVHMMSQKIQGTWNFTNPGTIEHNQILEMYKEIVDQNFSWKNFSQTEQDAILLSKRSNNHLDTTKLTIYWELYKHEIRDMFSHAEFSEIKDAVKKTLKEYSIYKNI